MASLTAQAPDGNSLNVDIPEGTDPSMYDAIADDAVKHYSSTLQSPVESAARGALRNFPMAQQAAASVAPINPLSAKGNYSDELQHLTDAAEQGKAQNPISYGAGAVAGSLAPMAIPAAGEALGMAGPALEAAGGTGIMGGAATGATQAVSDTNLVKNPGQAAGQAALGAGIGGALGGIGKAINAVAPSAEEMAARSTAKGMGATARNIGKVMGDEPDSNMAELGNWLNEKTDIGLADRPGKILGKVQDIHDVAGKAIGAIIDDVAPDVPIPKGSVTKDLYPIADELNIISPESQTKVMNVINKINALDGRGELDFSSLQKIKATVGKAVESDPNMSRTYGVLADYMNGVVDEYGKIIKDPAQAAKYAEAKLDYRNASKVLPILRRAEGRDLAQGPLGNSGLLGMFGLASGVAGGHPAAGAASMAASAIGRPIGNMLGRNAALKAVPYMPAIAAGGRGLNQAAQTELADFLTSKLGKKE